MSVSPVSKLIALAALVALLPGCGTTSGILAAQTNLAADTSANAGPGGNGFGHGKRGGPGGERGRGGFGLPGLDVADLALTAEQQTAIQAVLEKYKPAAPEAKPSNDPRAALQTAVLADTVDDAALRAAIAAMEANRPAAPKADHGAVLTEIRAILTEEQRAKIVAKLQAAPTESPRPEPSGKPDRLASLNLTADQKAAVDALEAARKPAGDRDAMRAAMLAFWQTGDASGLAAPTPPAFPTEAFVKAVEILDLTQRKALFGQGEGGLMGRGHGGPGGPGGHEGGRGGERG